MKITVKQGDITDQQVDAIVNAANSFGFMGGGVAGAIKRAGGIEIESEAVRKGPTPVGSACITNAGSLKAKHVIHTTTMKHPAERIEKTNIEKATLAALICADENKLKTIAIPGLGTGVGGVSLHEAAKIMVKVIKKFKPKSLKEAILIDIGDEMVNEFKKAL